MADSTVTVNRGGGCLGCIFFCFAIWGLIFGVTWGGVHYAVGCSSKDGVHIDQEKR